MEGNYSISNPLLRIFLLATLGLATPAASIAQQAGKPLPTAAELKKDLAIIEASTEGESEALDQLMSKTARQLVAYLGAHDLSKAAAENLGLDLSVDSKDAAHFKVYTYSYSSGGTRGTIHRPVFQWQNAAGKLFAYRPDKECDFSEIYKLATPGRTQYLLLGAEKGDSQCLSYEAHVIELKGNYLLLDNPAFGKGPTIHLCNVEMTFDASQQALRLD